MQSELFITVEDGFVQVIAEGDKDFSFSTRLWTDVSRVCRENNCYKVLGIANSTKTLTTAEAFDHVQLFEDLKISSEYRIAWVEHNPKAYDTISLIETLLKDRGFEVRLFPEVNQAKSWLLGTRQARADS